MSNIEIISDVDAIEQIQSFLQRGELDDIARILSFFKPDMDITVSGTDSKSGSFRNGEPFQSDPFEILAIAHTDDNVVKVYFDATPWFEQANYKDILELAQCSWGGDYPADNLAIWMADKYPELEDIFDYTRLAKTGFECSIDAENAMNWLRINRASLADVILADEDIITDIRVIRE